MTLVLTPGQRHEAPVFPQLRAQGSVKGAKGRPRLRPHRVVGDKGYSSRAIRQYARQHGIRITIPRKVNECRKGPFDRTLYKKRNLVERLINRLKQFRRLATRYEKRAAQLSGDVGNSGNPPMVVVCKHALVLQPHLPGCTLPQP